jgi:heme exporter protein B
MRNARFARQVYAILAKDLLLEARTKDALAAMAVFSLLALVTFSFALDLTHELVSAVGPGVVWVTVVFASMLGLGRTFARERDQGTLDGMLIAPVEPSAVFLAKLLLNVLLMTVVLLVSVPCYAALFDVQVEVGQLVSSLALGVIGLAVVGTLFSAVASHTRAREVMLPVLMLPVIVPLLIGVVQATGPALGGSRASVQPWLALLLAFDAIYFAIGLLVFEHALED